MRSSRPAHAERFAITRYQASIGSCSIDHNLIYGASTLQVIMDASGCSPTGEESRDRRQRRYNRFRRTDSQLRLSRHWRFRFPRLPSEVNRRRAGPYDDLPWYTISPWPDHFVRLCSSSLCFPSASSALVRRRRALRSSPSFLARHPLLDSIPMQFPASISAWMHRWFWCRSMRYLQPAPT